MLNNKFFPVINHIIIYTNSHNFYTFIFHLAS